MGTVPMFAPDGTTGDIPVANVAAAKSSGFKQAYTMYSPDGKPGYIPEDRVSDAMKAGFKQAGPDATTANNSVEKSAPKPYYGFTPGNMASQAWEGVKELGQAGAGMVKDAVAPQGNTEGQRLSFLTHKYLADPLAAEQQKADTASTGSERVGHTVASYLPFVGPWAAGLGEQAGSGDIGGAGARAGAQFAAAEAAEPVMRGAKVGSGLARDAVSKGIYDTTGELKPSAKAAAQFGGGAVGAGYGIIKGNPTEAFAGGATGYKYGPSVVQKAFPSPPVYPGASLPSASEFYENRGTDLIKRGQQQAILDRQAAREAKANAPEPPAPELGSPENPGWHAKLPTRMPTAPPPPEAVDPVASAVKNRTAAYLPARMPKAAPPPEPSAPSPFQGMTPTNGTVGAGLQLPTPSPDETIATGPMPKFLEKFAKPAAPEKSTIVAPDSAPPKSKVTYQSIPQEDLLSKVKAGDQFAIREWQRRGLPLPPNVGYMVESGAGKLPWRNPRR